MTKAILAGFFIGIGAAVYLTLGGVVGAAFFSVGLATILVFGFSLFTGKAGLLATGEIRPWELLCVWVWNCAGVYICALLLMLTPIGAGLVAKAAAIVDVRNSNTMVENLVLGIFCGVLMYAAVAGYKKTGNLFYIVLPVVTFIMVGCNHCVADMAYIMLGSDEWADLISLVPTTAGNVIGCNFIPLLMRLGERKADG